MGYSLQRSKELDITERLTHTHTHTHSHPYLCIYHTEGTSLLVCPLDYELPEGRDCAVTLLKLHYPVQCLAHDLLSINLC